MRERYDVGIVGYGPVGQTLAILLGMRGWHVGVWEKQAAAYPLPRAVHFDQRIIPINFSSQVSLGMSSEGEENKSKTKPFAVTVLQDYSNSHRIVYSSTDLEMITELERMTYTKTPSRELIYKTLTEKGGKKGEDHFTSALLCGALAFYLLNESLDFRGKRKRLARAFWNK